MSSTPSSTPPTTPRTPEEFITFLAGRYASLQDARTVSGTRASRKFNSYVYTRKLLIHKTLQDDPGHHKIFCTHCTKGQWTVDARSTTSSLQLRHIRHRHPSLPTTSEEESRHLEQLEISQKSSIKHTPFSIASEKLIATRKQLDRFDNKVLREYISRFLINTNTSLSIVENHSFQQLLQYCNPTAAMISRRTASRGIIALYNRLQPRIKDMLQEVTTTNGGRISITLDAWTSSTQIPFLGITRHFIEPSTWKYRSVLLGFERLSGSHSAQALGEVTINILNRFHIAGSLRAITADSASVNTAMFRNFEKEAMLSGFTQEDCHVRCMGHVINLAVQTLLKALRVTALDNEAHLVDEDDTNLTDRSQIYAASYKSRKIIAKIRSSHRLWESLEAQSQAARISPKRPILDMPVRWNSTHAMLERILELRPAIDAVCRYVNLKIYYFIEILTNIYCRLEERLQRFQLSIEEWSLLQHLKDILDIFIKATEHLSGSSYPTLSAQLPYFSVLATRLEAIVDKERASGSIFHEACVARWQKLDEYHCKTGSAQSIATILDPRCKLQTFRNLSWQDQWIAEAETAIQRVYKQQYAPHPVSRPSTPPASSSQEYLEDDFMTAVFGTGSSQLTELSVMSELDIYLEEKVELPQVDPIEWWRTYESRFPNLSRMARDYLAIPATSVPSERCFSLAGNVLTKQRSSMTEGMANAIMCCKYWLGYDEFSTQDMLQERVLVEESPEGDIDMTEEDET